MKPGGWLHISPREKGSEYEPHPIDTLTIPRRILPWRTCSPLQNQYAPAKQPARYRVAPHPPRRHPGPQRKRSVHCGKQQGCHCAVGDDSGVTPHVCRQDEIQTAQKPIQRRRCPRQVFNHRFVWQYAHSQPVVNRCHPAPRHHKWEQCNHRDCAKHLQQHLEIVFGPLHRFADHCWPEHPPTATWNRPSQRLGQQTDTRFALSLAQSGSMTTGKWTECE